MTSGEPFSWAGLTRIKRDPDGPIARLLGHSQASLISEALHRAFELAYGGEEKQAKRREFLRRFNNERSAVEALHELFALALLRVERWRLLQVEPSLGGPKHPDFLMATLTGEQVLVEVKTVHRADAFAQSDDRRIALADTLMRNLAVRGYPCRFLDFLCSPSELAAAPPEPSALSPK